jgi:lipopolysaccharide export system protein LptA
LRRWVAALLIVVCAAVAGVYFHARKRVHNTLKQVPEKIGIDIQQSAQGFTISKSAQGRTLFKLQASKAVQFKSDGTAELHDVAITLYGRDSSRFDQVYGKEFGYDPRSGDVTSRGEVDIDLQSNPEGILNPDQTPPKELKNLLHLRTTNFVFNKNSGDAATNSKIEFSVPQANGSAIGANYVAAAGLLTLKSDVNIQLNGPDSQTIHAGQAVLEKNPRQILLRSVIAVAQNRRGQADELTLFLGNDNAIQRAEARGEVEIQFIGSANKQRTQLPNANALNTVTADRLELGFRPGNLVEAALFSGHVHLKADGAQSAEAWAGRARMDFSGRNVLERVHADEGAKLIQAGTPAQSAVGRQSGSGQGNPRPQSPQTVEVTAPAMDLFVAQGNRLTRAETSGPPQISLSAADQQSDRTRVTADKFTAAFDSSGQLSRVHGETHARIVSPAPPQNGAAQPDRISTSDVIDAFFRPGKGIDKLLQQGHFQYAAGTQRAFADSATYTPENQLLVLNGSPRIVDTGMETTAIKFRINRVTGEAYADGDVKTSYNELTRPDNGALLASADPIHVTARSMTAHNSGTATYSGDARLWQNANLVAAPTIEFHKDGREVIANSDSKHKVSMVLSGADQNRRAAPVSVTASRVIYRDSERKAHCDGEVTVRSADLTITSNQMDVYLASAGEPQASAGAQATLRAKLDKIVATGSVHITQPSRRATGDQLTYTASDDKFVLTGGPPSIFDAERGKITGVSLTLFRHDDRVVVEGDSRSPAVTHMRMER